MTLGENEWIGLHSSEYCNWNNSVIMISLIPGW